MIRRVARAVAVVLGTVVMVLLVPSSAWSSPVSPEPSPSSSESPAAEPEPSQSPSVPESEPDPPVEPVSGPVGECSVESPCVVELDTETQAWMGLSAVFVVALSAASLVVSIAGRGD